MTTAARSMPLMDAGTGRCCGGTAVPAAEPDGIEELTGELTVLAHPVRLRLLAELAASPAPVCVCDLEAAVPVKQPTVSHHLRVLREAGLVESERRGPWAHYSLRTRDLARLRSRIVDGLDRVLPRGEAAPPRAPARRPVPVLRPATPQDAAAVLALLRAAGLPETGVAAGLEVGYIVAEAAGQVVGAAGLEIHGRDGLLRSVVVAPDWQGSGLGAALVRERLTRARGLELEGVYLLTTTAASWFPRLGFEPVERGSVPPAVAASAEFAGVCPSTAAVLAARPAGLAAAGLKAEIRQKYGEAALAVRAGGSASCCGGGEGRTGAGQARAASCCGGGEGQAAAARPSAASCCGGGAGEVWNPITSDLYAEAEAAAVSAEAMLASLGCGNPTALAELAAGETVLDLGSGGGIDVLLSARRVGPTGRAYGLDMTDEMLELARSNQAKAGADNVEFLKGDIESIPLPAASVDVIISNCVINLAADKGQVFREAFRVLRPGGRLAISDIVARREVPEALRGSMALWVGCIAGALHEAEYARLLADAGFTGISLEPTRIYGSDDARQFLEASDLEAAPDGRVLEAVDGAFASAFIRAVKPA